MTLLEKPADLANIYLTWEEEEEGKKEEEDGWIDK